MTIIPGDVPDDFAFVPRLDIQAVAGSGVVALSEEAIGFLAFQASWLRRKGVNPDFARVLTTRGDSMEPTIRDGDVLLVDVSIDRVVDNAIYIVIYAGAVLVKRVQLARDGSLVLRSDNKVYDDEVVPSNEVDTLNVAGRVMWFGRSI